MTTSRFPSICPPLLLAAAIGFSLQASAGAQGSLPLCPEDVNARWHDCLGVRREPTGTTYVGEWRDNRYNGLGSLHAPDGGVILSGVWKDMGFVREAFVPWSSPRLQQESRTQVTARPQAPQAVVEAPPQQAAVRPQPQQAAITTSPDARRFALVIGNTKYRHSPALENPTRDAELLAATPRSVGFQSVAVKSDLTREGSDLTREGMIQALREFAPAADGAEWAMVHFSGHGIEFGGANYLIPVDAQLKADRDIDIEAVNMGQVLNAIEGAKRLRLVILDACRDNPFAGQMRRTMATRSLGRGLARVEPEAGTLVVYAAKHGETALDGEGRNSPFVEAMVTRIQQKPALEVRRLFDLVRDDVIRTTSRKQQSFSYGSLSGSEDFYFVR